jgi:hypothetical protein
MALAPEGLRLIDAHTHLTEAHDLWTKRAPAAYQDRVPQVTDGADGRPTWIMDGSRCSATTRTVCTGSDPEGTPRSTGPGPARTASHAKRTRP